MHKNHLFPLVSKEMKAIASLGAPIITGQLAQMSMGFVDTIMAGNLSPNDLAAVAIGSSFINPVFVFAIGLFMSLNPIIAQHLGAGRVDQIGRTVRHAGYLAFILAALSILILLQSDFLLARMGLDQAVADLSFGYIKAMLWGFLPITLYLVMRFFNEGMSISKPTMWFAVLGLFFNITGNYVFMFGKFGFPALGAVGTGWASALVAWVMFFGMLIYTSSKKSYSHLQIFTSIKKPEWHFISDILKVGVPNGVSIFMEVSMFAAVSLLMGMLGTTIVAGHQIAINIGSLIFMIPLGFSSAISVRVGTYIGSGSYYKAKIAGYSGIILCVGISIFTALFLLIFPEQMVSIYTSDSVVTQIAVSLLFLAALFQISDAIQVSSLGALRGLKDTTIPMIVNLIAYWVVGLPSGYILGISLQKGPTGLWMGLILGLSVAAVLHTWRFYRLSKTQIQLNPSQL